VTRHDVATPDMIRQGPAGFALVIRGGCAPVIARLPRAWKNRAYRRARRHGDITAEPAYEIPQADGWTEPGIPDHGPDDLIHGDDTSPWNCPCPPPPSPASWRSSPTARTRSPSSTPANPVTTPRSSNGSPRSPTWSPRSAA